MLSLSGDKGNIDTVKIKKGVTTRSQIPSKRNVPG